MKLLILFSPFLLWFFIPLLSHLFICFYLLFLSPCLSFSPFLFFIIFLLIYLSFCSFLFLFFLSYLSFPFYLFSIFSSCLNFLSQNQTNLICSSFLSLDLWTLICLFIFPFPFPFLFPFQLIFTFLFLLLFIWPFAFFRQVPYLQLANIFLKITLTRVLWPFFAQKLAIGLVQCKLTKLNFWKLKKIQHLVYKILGKAWRVGQLLQLR